MKITIAVAFLLLRSLPLPDYLNFPYLGYSQYANQADRYA